MTRRPVRGEAEEYYFVEDRGWIAAEWGLSEKGKRAKFYELTTAGRAQLRTRVREWDRYVASIGRVLRGEGGKPR